MKWKADYIPRTGLQMKYLRKLMTRKELADLIERYVEVKKKTLASRGERETTNKH